jgi:cysteine-rich repeat protein
MLKKFFFTTSLFFSACSLILLGFNPLKDCGNSSVDPGEQCDDGNQNSGDGCDSLCQIEGEGCGNGVREGNEACDGADLNGQDCQSLGQGVGTLQCAANCDFDKSACVLGEFSCEDFADNDDDGLIDCGDADCANDPRCGDIGTGGACTQDLDCKGGLCLIDDLFPEGYCSEFCTSPGESCGLPSDNGLLGICLNDVGSLFSAKICLEPCQSNADCRDFQYQCGGVFGLTQLFCLPLETCGDNNDDDFDGDTDCNDIDCVGSADCPSAEICNNNLDDDQNGFIDCADLSCDSSPGDADNDGLLDGQEDPNNNGFVDAGETNPLDADSDDGGLADGLEVLNGTNPNDTTDDNTITDTDLDGLSDAAETNLGTNSNILDTDGDSATDGQEVTHGLNPLAPDTNGNGILDGNEFCP